MTSLVLQSYTLPKAESRWVFTRYGAHEAAISCQFSKALAASRPNGKWSPGVSISRAHCSTGATTNLVSISPYVDDSGEVVVK